MKLRMHLSLPAALLICIFALAVSCSAQAPQPPKSNEMEDVTYDKWGFRVSIPKPFQKHVLPETAEFEISDIYIHNDFGYLVRVRKVPANTLPATAIEQYIQSQVQEGTPLGQTKRWELYSAKRQLFKGLNRTVAFDEATLSKAPYLKTLTASGKAFCSGGMAELRQDAGATVCIGIVGPPAKSDDIENYAKFAIFNVARTRPGGATSRPPVPGMPAPGLAPPGANGGPGVRPKPPTAKKTATPAVEPPRVARVEKQPGATPGPKPTVEPKPLPPLKKGDIELTGAVQSFDAKKKALVMLVEQIALPAQGVLPLNPPRPKTVLVTKAPSDVSVGARILVRGRNDGVGRSIKAEVLRLVPAAVTPPSVPSPSPPAEPAGGLMDEVLPAPVDVPPAPEEGPAPVN